LLLSMSHTCPGVLSQVLDVCLLGCMCAMGRALLPACCGVISHGVYWHAVRSPETVGRRLTFHLVRIIKLMLVSSLEEVGGVRRSARTWEAIVALYYAALQHPTIRIYDYIGDARST